MVFRFIHTADIHLDSPLRSLALRDPELAELVGDATRQSFIGIVDLCLAEKVDALVIAGDLFDGDQTSMKTARFLAGQLHRLHQAGVKTLKIRGNHDNLSRISKQLTFPDSVTVFGGRAETVLVEAGGRDVVFHGLSFAHAKAPESLLGKYPGPRSGAINIGIMHTSLGGTPEHDVYAPCSPVDLHQHGFHYWALGHVHVRSVQTGASQIVMPGTPQGRDIGEAGAKSATLVTIRDDGSIELEERLTAVAQFERVRIDVTDVDDWLDLIGSVRSAIEKIRSVVSAPNAVVRVHIMGATPLSWAILRDRDLLLAEAQHAGASTGGVWVEKIELDVRPPQNRITTDSDPVFELAAAMHASAKSDTFRAIAKADVLKLMGELPPEARNFAGATESDIDAFLDGLLPEAADLVTARLRSEPEE